MRTRTLFCIKLVKLIQNLISIIFHQYIFWVWVNIKNRPNRNFTIVQLSVNNCIKTQHPSI